jgi:hypothetical protein
VLQSFDLTQITPKNGRYEISACSKAQRENFHYKGIIKFDASIVGGRVRFGAWSFVYYSPRSCDQKEDSPI